MIPAPSGSSEWFAQRNLEYLFVSGGCVVQMDEHILITKSLTKK